MQQKVDDGPLHYTAELHSVLHCCCNGQLVSRLFVAVHACVFNEVDLCTQHY